MDTTTFTNAEKAEVVKNGKAVTYTDLHRAAIQGDVRKIKRILLRGAGRV